MPPPTAELALAAPLEGDTIQPPPVTKSVAPVPHTGVGGGDAGQVMSACTCETITSASGAPLPGAGLLATTWRALTSMPPDWPFTELDCSLITTEPALAGSWMVWLVAPEIVMRWPLMTTLARSELPLADGLAPLHWAVASDMRKSAAIVFPATVRL